MTTMILLPGDQREEATEELLWLYAEQDSQLPGDQIVKETQALNCYNGLCLSME